MCLQRLQCVLEVLPMESLLGALVVGLAGGIKLISGILVVLLQDTMQEDIPHFGRNVTSLGAEQQVLEVVTKFFDFAL